MDVQAPSPRGVEHRPRSEAGAELLLIEPLGTVWEAEPVHQDFYARQPYNGYCQFVINPKLAKVRQGYAEFLTTS